MNKGQKKRITKLEKVLNPIKLPRVLLRYRNESEPEEPREDVIAKHLIEHPEDKGLEFEIINIVWVSPDNKHVE